ncbi:MAG: hypothetical protein ABI373_06450 [Flavobacteriales bacterium]
MKARRSLYPLLLLLAFATAPAVVHAQTDAGPDQVTPLTAKAKEQRTKAINKEVKKMDKQHLADQDKATRKRMKQHERRAKKQGNSGQREPFLRRLFHGKH